MLLTEIANVPQEQVQKWFSDVNAYVLDNKSTPEFEVAIRKLVYVFPDCKYTGDMYRAVTFPKQTVIEAGSIEGLNNVFAQYKSKFKRNLFGWGTDLQSTEIQFVTRDANSVTFMMHQRHVGVNIEQLYQRVRRDYPKVFENPDFNEGWKLAVDGEFEVIATVSPSAQIIKLYVDGKPYSIQDLPKIIRYLK